MVWENVDFCTSRILAAGIERLACRAISASAELLVSNSDEIHSPQRQHDACAYRIMYYGQKVFNKRKKYKTVPDDGLAIQLHNYGPPCVIL